MTPLKLIATLTLVIASCYAFPKRMSPENQQLLSQLFSSKLVPNTHNLYPVSTGQFTSQDDGNEDNFEKNNFNEDSDDSDSIKSSYQGSPQQRVSSLTSSLFHSIGDDNNIIRPISLYPLQNAINEEAMMRLRAGVLGLAGGIEDEGSDVMTGRGKRFIPGLNSLMMARMLGSRNARFIDASKWKRQPHLGFHASRG